MKCNKKQVPEIMVTILAAKMCFVVELHSKVNYGCRSALLFNAKASCSPCFDKNTYTISELVSLLVAFFYIIQILMY